MPEWFEEWFGETYLKLYPHRDAADALRLIELIKGSVPWQDRWRVLDVASGAGRHAQALERLGARVVGVDLSWPLLQRAKDVTRAPLVRADMRALPIRPDSMDLTLNLFTSFGYFATDAEHAAVLESMADTLRSGGWFVIDFLNERFVRDTLVPEETTVMAGAEVHITRRITADGRHVVKQFALEGQREFQERVRLFSATQLEQMLTDAGIVVRRRFGTFDGQPLAPDHPRVILIGQRR